MHFIKYIIIVYIYTVYRSHISNWRHGLNRGTNSIVDDHYYSAESAHILMPFTFAPSASHENLCLSLTVIPSSPSWNLPRDLTRQLCCTLFFEKNKALHCACPHLPLNRPFTMTKLSPSTLALGSQPSGNRSCPCDQRNREHLGHSWQDQDPLGSCHPHFKNTPKKAATINIHVKGVALIPDA